MRQFLHQYFFLLDKNVRKKLLGLFFLCVISALLDIIGIGLVGIFLTLMANSVVVMQHLPSLFDLPIFHHGNTLIYTAGTLVIVSFLIKTVVVCFVQKRIAAFSYGYTIKLKMRLMKAFQFAPYEYHLQQNSSSLVHRIDQVDTYTQGILIPSLAMLSNLVIVAAIVVFLLVLHPFGTLLLTASCSAFVWVNHRLLKLKVAKYAKICAIARENIAKNIHHGLGGLKEIRVLGKENYFLRRLEAITSDYAEAMGAQTLYQILPRYVIESILAVFIILSCLGSLMMGMSYAATISFVGIFAAAGARLLPAASQSYICLQQLRFATQTMNHVYQELKELERLNQHAIPLQTVTKLPFSTVSLQGISYHYPNGKQSALHNISFNITKGQSIGIMGTSGAGKSTLINLLLGFLKPQQGQILVDGKPIENLREWLNNIAYIPQQVFLLDDTIKHNIALGVEADQIDVTRVQAAIQMAQLEQVIRDLPLRVDTPIGENGIRLSGGQRQRIALARTFYHDRDIIVMDEATSSLDMETELDIIQSIQQLHGTKTLIIIAHRLSTIQHCDIILKLENGTIVRSGSFQEVVAL